MERQATQDGGLQVVDFHILANSDAVHRQTVVLGIQCHPISV